MFSRKFMFAPLVVLVAATSCNILLGLDQYRDYCPPVGVGVEGACVADSSGGDGGAASSTATTTGSAGGGVNCGTCMTVAHGSSACVEGVCKYTCDEGRADCDDDLAANGCETDVATDLVHCGSCGRACVVECKHGSCNDPTSISVGLQHSCAVLADGTGWCWGLNDQGQLGDGTTTTSFQPVRIAIAAPLLQVSAGGDPIEMESQTCAVTRAGSVYCWGTRTGDAIGDGSNGTGVSKRPVLVNSASSVPGAKRVNASYLRGCAIDAMDGENQDCCQG